MGANLSQETTASHAEGSCTSGTKPTASASSHSMLVGKTALLTNDQAAAYIGVTPGTLEVWRCTKRYNIAYIKVGRLVRYKQSSLDTFIESRTVEA